MEVKAKGVSVQRGDRQPLNVRSSCSKPQLAIRSSPAVISKWLPVCDWSQRSSIQGAGTRPGGAGVPWCYLSGSVQRLTFSDVFHCHFQLLELEANKARLV